MNYLKISLLFLLIGNFSCAKKQARNDIKLLVLLSIDQMRWDYPEKFEKVMPQAFQRLKSKAFRFERARHHHAFAGTAQGHATLATGCLPKNHGIMSNYLYDRLTNQKNYSIADSKVSLEAYPEAELMSVSPRALNRPSIGDIVKSRDSLSRSYSIALKDRSAILMGGKQANRAFWFDIGSTRFISNSWYAESFPDFLKEFDGRTLYAEELRNGWQIVRLDGLTLPYDHNPHEVAVFSDSFPHNLGQISEDMDWKEGLFLLNTPYGDGFTLEAAKAIISNYSLGADEHIDVLTIGCSAADYIGHHFGPNSLELLLYYQKLDEYLASFLDYLDQTIGFDSYLFVLSSDHGITEFPEDKNVRRISRREFTDSIKHLVKIAAEQSSLQFIGLIKYIDDYGIYFNDSILNPLQRLERDFFLDVCAKSIAQLSFIEETYLKTDMNNPESQKFKIDYYRSSFIEQFWPDLVILQKPNVLLNQSEHGTDHNSVYDYDTDVPIYFLGPGIRAMHMDTIIRTVDVVPTLLDAIGLSGPHQSDGRSVWHLISEGHK